MAIKIIQTGDVHLGAKFEGLGDKGVLQRKQIEKVFERAIQTAIDQKANLFLIAGDLFDTDNPSQGVVDFVRRQLDRLGKSDIYTIIIPGNHDFLSDRSVYRKDFWNDISKAFVFNNPEDSKKEFPDLDLTIYAKILTTKNSTESPVLKSLSIKTKNNIMIAHGSFIPSEGSRKLFFDQWPIMPEEIENSQMDYIALGNFHGVSDVSQGGVSAWYCGSPESLAFDQKNSGFVLSVEVSGGDVKVSPIKVGERKFDQIEIILDNISDSSELKNKILEGAEAGLVRKVVLSGFVIANIFLDEELLESELGEHFFKLIVVNKTVPKMPDLDSGKYSSDLVVGRFLDLVKERINNATSEPERDILQKALQLGLAELES